MSLIGNDAINAGMEVVPDSGENGKVRWGAREINRTRDYVAQVLSRIPLGRNAYRTAAGITSNTTEPNDADGEDGDIYFKVLEP